jgi:hypothetical protein
MGVAVEFNGFLEDESLNREAVDATIAAAVDAGI